MAFIQGKRIFSSNIEKLTFLKCIWKSSQTLESIIQQDAFCSCWYCYTLEKKISVHYLLCYKTQLMCIYFEFMFNLSQDKIWGEGVLLFSCRKTVAQNADKYMRVLLIYVLLPILNIWYLRTLLYVPFSHSRVCHLRCPSSIDSFSVDQVSFDF